jgi:hypothetical protein
MPRSLGNVSLVCSWWAVWICRHTAFLISARLLSVSSWAQSRPCSIHVLMLQHHHLIFVVPQVLRDPVRICQYMFSLTFQAVPAAP